VDAPGETRCGHDCSSKEGRVRFVRIRIFVPESFVAESFVAERFRNPLAGLTSVCFCRGDARVSLFALLLVYSPGTGRGRAPHTIREGESRTVPAVSLSNPPVRSSVHSTTTTHSNAAQIHSGPTRSGSPFVRSSEHSRTIVTGCWATSDRSRAAAMPGVDAVI